MASSRKMLANCPDLMEQWDYSKNTGVSPLSLSAGSGYIAWWLCEKGHSWQASVNHRHRGTGCPVCANRIVIKGVNDLETMNPALTAQWNHEKNGSLKPCDVPNGTHRKVWWRCPEGRMESGDYIARCRDWMPMLRWARRRKRQNGYGDCMPESSYAI